MYSIQHGSHKVDFPTVYDAYQIPEYGELVSTVDAANIGRFYNTLQGDKELEVGTLTMGNIDDINILKGGLSEITNSFAIVPINNVVLVMPLSGEKEKQALILSRNHAQLPEVQGLVRRMQVAWPF